MCHSGTHSGPLFLSQARSASVFFSVGFVSKGIRERRVFVQSKHELQHSWASHELSSLKINAKTWRSANGPEKSFALAKISWKFLPLCRKKVNLGDSCFFFFVWFSCQFTRIFDLYVATLYTFTWCHCSWLFRCSCSWLFWCSRGWLLWCSCGWLFWSSCGWLLWCSCSWLLWCCCAWLFWCSCGWYNCEPSENNALKYC